MCLPLTPSHSLLGYLTVSPTHPVNGILLAYKRLVAKQQQTHVHMTVVPMLKHLYTCPYFTQTFEGNYCLINAVLSVRTVAGQKSLFHRSNDGLHLLQPTEPGLIPQRQNRIVHKVEVAATLQTACGWCVKIWMYCWVSCLWTSSHESLGACLPPWPPWTQRTPSSLPGQSPTLELLFVALRHCAAYLFISCTMRDNTWQSVRTSLVGCGWLEPHACIHNMKPHTMTLGKFVKLTHIHYIKFFRWIVLQKVKWQFSCTGSFVSPIVPSHLLFIWIISDKHCGKYYMIRVPSK